MLEKIKNAYKESNHSKHFNYGILTSLFGTIIFTIGCAVGMEYKEKQYKDINNFGNGWDWDDFWWTVGGGLIGQIIQVLIIFLII